MNTKSENADQRASNSYRYGEMVFKREKNNKTKSTLRNQVAKQ